MTINKTILLFAILGLFLASCEENDRFPSDHYACDFSFVDSSSSHPNASRFQDILDRNQKNGLVGVSMMIKDKHGVWIGASGKADIASDVDMRACNTFLIASISKSFTAAATFAYIDDGVLSLNDPISKWLPEEVIKHVANAEECEIQHLLSHKSGIADFYTPKFELDRLNRIYNEWTMEDVLEYVYGLNATNEVGEVYSYSNTNYLLLAMILENASGLSFAEVYEQKIFAPLQFTSAYYSESNPIPQGAVKGYYDLYDNGQFAETEFWYKDELGIGGDGGIAINAYELGVFLEELGKGSIVSASSFEIMTDWFEPSYQVTSGAIQYFENGYGLENYRTDYGNAFGHEGGIDGFSSLAVYFPEDDATFVLLVNSVSDNEAEDAIAAESLAIIFE